MRLKSVMGENRIVRDCDPSSRPEYLIFKGDEKDGLVDE
jgi:hypothetical protein